MPRLTDMQAILLNAAAARGDLTLLPAPKTLQADGPALERAIKSLLRRGLIAVSDDRRGATTEAGTHPEDIAAGEEPGFTITPSGLAAIGIEEAETTAGPSAAKAPTEGASPPADASVRPAGGRRQRKAASGLRRGEDAAEAASAAAPAVGEEASEPAHRATKKERLIALLSAEAGVDIATLSAALGWQTHTTRAALTGLRKAGYRLEGSKPPSGGGQRYRIAA